MMVGLSHIAQVMPCMDHKLTTLQKDEAMNVETVQLHPEVTATIEMIAQETDLQTVVARTFILPFRVCEG